MSNITKIETLPPAPNSVAMTPMAMLDRAISQGAGIDVLERLMALDERWQANQARKAFDLAMANAKAKIKPIVKNRKVDFTSSKGRTNYNFEDLAQIDRQVSPALSEFGLSYRFRVSSEANQPIAVTCIISHRDGHSEETTLSAGRDESGNKNSIQSIGSTVTYLQRYTLKAALGLAASEDDDGRAAGEEQTYAITDEQRDELLGLIEQTGTDIERFCAAMAVDAINELPSKQFGKARALLNRKLLTQQQNAGK